MSKIIINLEQNENINVIFKKETFKRIDNLIIYSEDEKLNKKLEKLYSEVINNLKENINFKPKELDQIIGFNLYLQIKNNEIVITDSFQNFEKILKDIENNIIENVNYFKLFIKSNNIKDIKIKQDNDLKKPLSTKDILVDNANINLELINAIRKKQSNLEGRSHSIRCLNESLQREKTIYDNNAPQRAKDAAYNRKMENFERMFANHGGDHTDPEYRKFFNSKLNTSAYAHNSKIFWEEQGKWSGRTFNDMLADAKEESTQRRNQEAYEKYQRETPDKLSSINNSGVFALLELGSK